MSCTRTCDSQIPRRNARAGVIVCMFALTCALAAGDTPVEVGIHAYTYSSKQVEQPLRRSSYWGNFEQQGLVLSDGRVAMFMSREGAGLAIFDPKTESITIKKHAAQQSPFHLAMLPDDKVLLLSGRQAEIYDVRKDEYAPVKGEFPNGHIWYCGFCRLPDGRYFFSGSFDQHDSSDICCYFDPKFNTFTPAGKMAKPRARHSVTWIGDNQILIAGGQGKDYYKQTYDTLEIFDIGTGTSRMLPATMKYSRAGHGAIRLKDGTVLFVGGESPANNHSPPPEAEVFDSKAQTVSPAGTMARPRRYGILAPLPSGRVAVFYGDDYTRLVEIYVPETKSFVLADQLTMEQRVLCYTESIAMPDGRVLNVGTRGNFNDKEIVAFLEFFTEEKRLVPDSIAPGPKTIPADVATLLNDLSADDFAKRDAATEKLSKRIEELRVWIEPLKDSPDPEVKARVMKLLGKVPVKNRAIPWMAELRLRNGQMKTVTLADSRVLEWCNPKDQRVTQILAAAREEKIDEILVRFPKSYSYQTQGLLFELVGLTGVRIVKLGSPLQE